MRITYIHQHFKRPCEAGGTRSWEFARRLASDGHKVTVIAGGQRQREYWEKGFRVVQIGTRYSNSMGKVARLASFSGFMVRACAVVMRIPADIVIATSTPLTVAIPGLLASWKMRARFVFEVRDLWPEVPVALGILRDGPLVAVARLLERLTYRRADRVIALSPSMAKGVLDVDPTCAVSVVPNACDFDSFDLPDSDRAHFRKLAGLSDQIVLTYAGSLGRSYDVGWIVDVAARISDPSISFRIIGKGALSADLEAKVLEFKLEPSRVLLGELAKRDVCQHVAAADCLISTLVDNVALEGNSLNKVFDALAAGRPIIFNHGGWLSDLVTAQGAGWRVSRDPLAAAKEIEAIVMEGGFGLAGVRARELGLQNFNRDSLYREFRQALLGDYE